MSRGGAVRKADLDRVFKALRDTGHTIRCVEIRPGGHVVIVPAAQNATLETPEAAGELNALDDWRAKRHAQR